MRIESIQIDAYGPFNRVRIGPLSRHLTIIYEPDNQGEPTLPGFIREVLFGFSAGKSPVAPVAATAGRYGGRLILCDINDERHVIERYRDADGGEAQITIDGEPTGDDALLRLLANMPADLYRSIFMFGIDELRAVDVLATGPVSGYISSEDLGAGHWLAASAGLLRNPSTVEGELAVAGQDSARCRQLRRRRKELEFEIQRIESQLDAVNQIEQRIADDHRRIALAGECLAGAESSLAEFEREMTDSCSSPAVNAVARRAYDELRESWTRLQAIQRMTGVYQRTVNRQRIPRSPWFLVMLMAGFLIPAVLGVITDQPIVIAIGIASAALGLITLAISTIARSRFESAQLQARLHLDVTRREAEGRFLHAVMAIGIDPVNIDQEIERLEKAQSSISDARHDGMSARDQEISHDERRNTVADARDALGELVQQIGEAQRDWDRLAAGLELPEEVRGAPGLAREFLEHRQSALLAEQADIDRDVRQLETTSSSSLPRARRQEFLMSPRGQPEAPDTRDAACVPGGTCQSDVLQAAGDVFDAMTLGAYHRFAIPDGSEEIVAVGRDGREVAVADMADGTRQAANLALRIGLIRSASLRWSPMPVLVGDILTGFDSDRANEAIRALAGLASDHQVILFTCHPSTVEFARSASPGVRVIAPGSQSVSSPAAIWLGDD